MEAETGDWIVGVMMGVFGLIGLFLFGHAADGEMAVFGAALVAFSLAFVFGLIKQNYDRHDAAHAKAKDAPHD
jgi:hypothetical protein